jgi:hypothetical protein
MPRQTPEPGPDDEQAAALADQRYLDWQVLLEALAAGGSWSGAWTIRTPWRPPSGTRWRTGG